MQDELLMEGLGELKECQIESKGVLRRLQWSSRGDLGRLEGYFSVFHYCFWR